MHAVERKLHRGSIPVFWKINKAMFLKIIIQRQCHNDLLKLFQRFPLACMWAAMNEVLLLSFSCGVWLTEEQRTLDIRNETRHWNASRATFGTIEHRAAAKGSQSITEDCQALGGSLITTIEDEAMRVNDRRRTNPLRVPPGHGTRTRTGRTENAFGALIVARPLLWRLDTLGEWWRLIIDQVGLDLLILGEKRLQVNHEIFDHRESEERLDRYPLSYVTHEDLAGQAIAPVYAHRIGATDAVSTRPTKGEGAILLPLDLVERVQQTIALFNGGPELCPVGSGIFFRIKALDLECGYSHDTSPQHGLLHC
jgi:hypothetical protein